MSKTPSTNWHRLFGLGWLDLAEGTTLRVEVEKDLSIQKQLLDILVLRIDPGPLAVQFPDGLENLARHNLITFKSHQEALDDWTLKELTGHYVSYRKLVSPSWNKLLPEEQFRLYAICSRFPHNLANTIELEPVQDGVYRVRRGTDLIRVIVIAQLSKQEQNALLHLFSASKDLVQYGREHYRPRSEKASALLAKVLLGYAEEGMIMSYTLEDFERETRQEILRKLSPKERLQGLTLKERLQVLDELPAEEIEKYLKRLQKGKPKKKSPKRK